MANIVNMTSEKSNGKKITNALTHVNPNASDANVTEFVVALSELSDNTLKRIEKVSKTDLEIPND